MIENPYRTPVKPKATSTVSFNFPVSFRVIVIVALIVISIVSLIVHELHANGSSHSKLRGLALDFDGEKDFKVGETVVTRKPRSVSNVVTTRPTQIKGRDVVTVGKRPESKKRTTLDIKGKRDELADSNVGKGVINDMNEVVEGPPRLTITKGRQSAFGAAATSRKYPVVTEGTSSSIVKIKQPETIVINLTTISPTIAPTTAPTPASTTVPTAVPWATPTTVPSAVPTATPTAGSPAVPTIAEKVALGAAVEAVTPKVSASEPVEEVTTEAKEVASASVSTPNKPASANGVVVPIDHTTYKPVKIDTRGCDGSVDPFSSIPVEIFEPPIKAPFGLKNDWKDAQAAMMSSIRSMSIGGEKLREFMTKEVRKLQQKRFDLFCQYYTD